MDKERFFKVYANLPLNVRDQVVVVLDGEPVAWRVANLEIIEDTESGRQILEKLASLEII